MTAGSQKGPVYPVTYKQKNMLDQDIHPEGSDDLRMHWTISGAVLVRPGIDLRRLRRATQKLMERHDSLRLRFKHVAGSWQASIDPPPGQDPIRLLDLGDLDDETFDAKIKAIANAPMPVAEVPLIEIVILKCGARGDVGIARLHHTITDGYGMIILAEDFIKILLGMPLPKPALSFAQYLKHYALPSPKQKAKNDAFWHQMHADLPKDLNIGRRAKGRDIIWNNVGQVERQQIEFLVTPQSSASFTDRLTQMQISKSTLIFAAYLEALCQGYDLNQVLFRTHIPDPNPMLDTYAGDRTMDPILTYKPGGDTGFLAAARQLGLTLAEALDHFPAEATIRNTPYEKALVEAGYFTEQFSAHQPRATTRENRSVFSDVFSVEHGQEKQVGPYKLILLDTAIPKRSLYELQLKADSSEVTKGFTLIYDRLAFDQEEVHKIGRKICDLLALELSAEIVV